jgi:AcrR family transcriptional regulator
MVRPRSARAHQAVLDAATQLFVERGIDASSMDGIAAASGVSKATIYKHWPDKDALALEVLAHVHGLNEPRPGFDSDDVRANLVAMMTYEPAEDRRELKERLMPHLMAYSIHNKEFGVMWRERVVDRIRLEMRTILERGQRQGTIDQALKIDIGIAMLFGPILYRNIFVEQRKAAKPPLDFVEPIVDAFIRAFGTESGR